MSISDDNLRALTGYRLQRATGQAMMRHKAVFARFGLRRTTFSCLSLIVENPGLRQSQLGETLAIERPNLVGIVDDLALQGLVEKGVSPQDRRAYALSPTPKGRRVFKEALAAVVALDSDIMEGFTPEERAMLHDALTRIEVNSGSGETP